MKLGCLVAFLTVCFGYPVLAGGTPGVTETTLSFASTEDELGSFRGHFLSSVDVRITDIHGVQGDLRFSDSGYGLIGQLIAHVYMAPSPSQKIGAFFELSDVDGHSMAWGSAGVEGIVEFGDASFLEAHIGLGAADENSLDYVFGGLALSTQLSPSVEITADVRISDIDEIAFRATALETSLVARYRSPDSNIGAFASLTKSELKGRDAASGFLRLGFGLTFDFNGSSHDRAEYRQFGQRDAIGQIVRRGLW